MYLIRIEPVHSQGVGHFELVTNNIHFINQFRNELVRYKNHLKNEYSEDELDCWDFYEYIYKIINYKPKSKKFDGYCLHEKIYSGNFRRLYNLKNNKNIFTQLNELSKNLESFEYNDIILLDYVYNYIDIEIKPIHINNFDIIGNNYIKH